ncbi:MAG: response regulator [Myxococcales bacterium]|nr:response regulator [Myxococcales bacterium]
MPPSILVVDDDLLFRQVVSDVLTQKGYRVAAVENATLALEESAKAPFDVILTDLVMPGVDGLQLISRLRERDPDQEVILVSARQDAKAAATAMHAGAADTLLKPIEDADLLLSVQRALERALLRRERQRLLGENIEHARLQEVHRRGLELISSPDLEWLGERVLAELTDLCDSQSAALWISDERGEIKLKAYRGLLDRQFLPERVDRQGPAGERLKGSPWLGGSGPSPNLYLPLSTAGELVGLAQLSDPLAGTYRQEQVRDARALAEYAAVAIRNGRRFLSLQRHGLRDPDTAAYNLSYFTDYASKEIYKARRYGRTFSLLTFSIDNLPQVRLRLGAEQARRAARGIIRALTRIIRDSDVLAKSSDRELTLLLPETDFFGAMMFLRRAMAAAREEPEVQQTESSLPLGLVGGAATFPKDGEDFDELVLRCRRRADERRGSLQRKLSLEPLAFWDVVDLLLGNAQSPKLPLDDRAEPSRRGRVASSLFDELQAEVARELARDPQARGLVYVGGPEVHAGLPIAEGLEGIPPDFAFRVYLLGRRGDLDSHLALTPVFLEGDGRMARHEFLFWLSENAAYALVQRRGRGATWGFHTSDTAVVEGLITKLQAEYDLQPY